jgi:hypothetical protein
MARRSLNCQEIGRSLATIIVVYENIMIPNIFVIYISSFVSVRASEC